ncbi:MULTISPECIES: LptF/LptG family permease [unclassified Flavobacterium]|uniref:LptF/LptG family permease n=1 Tax=unclassified Flavobacterium TaxID=196869 RepID=UPI0012911B3A|nr:MULTISPECIES: LptF/LptG family permease [unclassified Flavobacterium]MQP53080.1 LptF/LptG family permease [Flavobacterium sp. LMO9]MQP62721.1 LptF/LptG family permease [Flavobacterium sp. LMO6]
MKIIDKYILKRYLVTFSVMLIMFIPIGITIDVSEKVNKMIEKKIPLTDILVYYGDFTVYFANLLFPIFLFLSIIWFTSKLANNTEIIAILSSGISFARFLRPFIYGAVIVSIFALLMGFFLVPQASKGFNDFRYQNLKGNSQTRETSDIFRQIKKEGKIEENIYVSNYNYLSQTGFNFTFEKIIDNKLVEKVTANRIRYSEKTKKYTLFGYNKRIVGIDNDKIEILDKIDLSYNFEPDDLTPVVYVAETMTIGQLNSFINKERARGNGNINTYLVVFYKKFSLPISAFILTIIAVAVSSMKRRGGMGINLAIGIVIAFTFIFFDKVFGTLAEKSSIPPFLAVWFPNIVFGILAAYLLRNAKR